MLEGRPETLSAVRGWIEAVVRFGAWRFSDPEAVVQEALLRLVRCARSGTFRELSSLRTFVHAVAKHTCVDVYRRERLRSETELGRPGPTGAVETTHDPQAELERRERAEALAYILQRLPEDCRRLWAWAYGEGLPAEEIARRLGTTAVNVRSRAHRCLEKARRIGREYGAGPHPAGRGGEP
jgi:RNA polymerase sigma factor (sigma-70 family)